ncbi:thiosulfate dehydrogenase [quinone] large subunit [Marinactinospora thermotolerans DSM 45154]|uniref:Thiosulfate dehydrogenase [quinone] large subunit n=1 Tax=Marinactinospora thermotolerans DSM 45154 TaxID=1122192 RepID=A0A1T4SUS6_9ACTN|nr:thiosulfate dehydrogenase [quinone] large subunit [Marinactinospora thermotolerans DSM 45154]
MSGTDIRSGHAPRRPEGPAASSPVAGRVWAATRICLGLVYLWAFFDKTFGAGFPTPPKYAWLTGNSPTLEFLGGARGPLSHLFRSLAENRLVDLVFMAGLFGIGAALLLGIGMRVAAAAGVVMMALLYLTALPPRVNPLIDEHVVYALVGVGLAAANAGDVWGLGRPWAATRLVGRLPWLR